ncbi:glycosyltransferase [Actinomadura macrotermitis]|uniref:Putative glycosyltransferase EpsD n=1 Tax=Actinomadura macrotermitis TaxID=2585200 RepID=A0A7K0BS21_9ACTN|nr:glycosyltransferase [Actinomadura macrotermitis]MQY03682.1 putative glycosyltransferase EpsD [Actinomadura macrotermitis]
MRPLRILHVSQPVEGGVAVYLAQAALDQQRRGWEVAVACPAAGGLPRRLAGHGIAHLPWEATRAPSPAALGEAAALGRIVQRVAPDVVHLHSAKAGLAGRLLPPRTPARIVFQPHGWSWLAASPAHAAASVRWERWAARRTDLLVCVGEGERELGVRHGVRGPLTVIRNGVDLTRFRYVPVTARRRAREELALPPDGPLAVCVGRVTRQKGQDVLLAAWPLVRRRCPDARLALVGDGDRLGPLRDRRPGPDGGDGVLFVPAVADTRPWLAAADVVTMPSRWEGLPLAALEAMATGRPLVASDIPGLAEVVGPATGGLVPPEDPEALADALAHRLLSPERAEREGMAAAEAATRFDAGVTLDRLAEATQSITAATAFAASLVQAGHA